MSKEKELRKRAVECVEEAKKIQAQANSEERELTDEEIQSVDKLLAESEKCLARADQIRRTEVISGELKKPLERLVPPDPLPQPNRETPSAEPKLPAKPRDHKKEGMYGWDHVGDFYSAVVSAYHPNAGVPDQRLFIGAAASGMQQKVGSQGGFLVPPTFSNRIWDGLNEGVANLLNFTDNYTVDGESLTIPANSETSRADGSRYGGVRGYWIDEADQITSSQPKFRQIKLEPHQLAALVYCTDKLLSNSPTALEQYVTRACTEELNFKIGNAIINGTGAGQPLGILNAGCLVSVAKETGQAAATIMSENIVKMRARLHPSGRARAVWLINVDVEPQLHLMTIGVGTSGLPAYMPPGGLSASPYGTLMGRPVVPIEYCQTLGTAGDIILADLGSYLVGQQGGINSAMSIHLRFDYAETCFRFITSIDGQPALASALTPFKGTNTLTSFVSLATRS